MVFTQAEGKGIKKRITIEIQMYPELQDSLTFLSIHLLPLLTIIKMVDTSSPPITTSEFN